MLVLLYFSVFLLFVFFLNNGIFNESELKCKAKTKLNVFERT